MTSISNNEQRPRKRTAKDRPQRPKRNPIESAIKSWVESNQPSLASHEASDLIAQAPKRWTAHGPMVLLPAGSFTTSAWQDVLRLNQNLSVVGDRGDELNTLWRKILNEIAASPTVSYTHLAVSEGIPPQTKDSDEENILRSPSGLRTLYGDFGPPALVSPAYGVAEDDFAQAFWVSTKQSGITQTWAPRWTMFSRGNIKEKARLLDFHCHKSVTAEEGHAALSHRVIPANQRRGRVAVDLYAGIGYFALCYASLGFRVLCWELNPWSVEGLRRGAIANGYSVTIVRPTGPGDEDSVIGDVLKGDETMIVFLEDNARAPGRIRKWDELTRRQEDVLREEAKPYTGLRKSDVLHVNCGLLPTSEGSWDAAWDIAKESESTWIHIHENVGVADIESKSAQIEDWFSGRAQGAGGTSAKTQVHVEHVEQVKTFAPGVWHCVFDLYISRPSDEINDKT
ncbi:S-adenosyl-L-methionine-dependent methyltransferase [Xylariaceae sp. FL1019]|nr:S-adenosyl-L-methionine-dependent methyltransferase [Xylariaceae sp. FL1019]